MITRRLLVRAALVVAVTASLGLFAAGGEPTAGGAAPQARIAPPAAPAAQQPREPLRIDLLARGAQERLALNAFVPRSWEPPPPPPAPARSVAPPPPPPPTAPPLPFTFLGTFDSKGGETAYYLVEGDKLHAVAEGEVVNGVYRVGALRGEELELVYLPLSISQTLALGGRK